MIELRPISRTGYAVDYDGGYIGTVDRSTRQQLWYWTSACGGAYGSTRTRQQAIDALVEMMAVPRLRL